LNLKTQCQIRENALRTAESLILAYQRENDTLKQEKQELQEEISLLDSKVASLEAQLPNVKTLERTVLKYSQKINELLEKNMANEHRIHLLEKELQRVSEAQITSEAERARAKLKAKEERHRKDLEGQFKNYLRLPQGEESSFAASMGANREEGDRRVLEWRLKQKDEEVIILLKRLRDTEERLDVMGKRGRQMTFDSMDGASTKQSKKLNVSEFEH
jgi:cell division septum initiation protein DivIVA